MTMLWDILAQTLRTLWAHKLRSFLTMFGVAWGVGSLLLLVGLGEGFRSGNQKGFASMGEDVMFMFAGRIPPVEGSAQGMRPYWLTYADYLSIRSEAKYVRNIAAVIHRGDVKFVGDFGNAGGSTLGVPAHFKDIRYLPVKEGRYLNEGDVEQKRLVAVLGAETRKTLFPGRPAVGSVILMNGVRFTVIGVLDVIGRGETASRNSFVHIPFSTMQSFFPVKEDNAPSNAISMFNYQPLTRQQNEEARKEVRQIIARNHGFDWQKEDAFEDWDSIKTAEMVGAIFTAMNMFLGSVGMVTLALGAIGIINIMLVSVSERTKEIGLRKALGATNRSILTQFFLEGAFLTVVSGGIGLAFAAAVMAALGTLPSAGNFDPPQLVAWSAALAIGSLSLAGVVAGLYPARKASLLSPVEALRKE